MLRPFAAQLAPVARHRLAAAPSARLYSRPTPVSSLQLQLLRQRQPSAFRGYSSTSADIKEAAKDTARNAAQGIAKGTAKQRSWPVKVIRFTAFTAGSMVFGLSALLAIIMAHDALTYSEKHVANVPAGPLALNPKPGGPKKLPVVSEYVENEQDEGAKELAKKERLVIVGGGWGAVALLQSLDPNRYNVTVIAPENFFLFTPLLPSATVGTVEARSLVEPLRKIGARVHSHYIQGRAVDVVMGSQLPPGQGGDERLLEVEVINDHEGKEGTGKHVYVPYDRLIVAVGAVTASHGVQGLEHCFHLKTVQDARRIRAHIMENLEIASLPTTSQSERDRLLSFVVSGGGPTGVETASEIYDMLSEDVLNYFPKLLRASARVHVIQSREHILNTYSEAISQYAEEKFARDEVDIITNARVKRVEPDRVIYTRKDPKTGELKEFEVASGFTLWSTGIAMSPFTKRLTELLPNQSHLKALQVDSHLRVKGAPLGSIYALGDASTIDTSIIDHLYDFVDACDQDHDGQLTFVEFQALAASVGRKFPLASKHLQKLENLFEQYDVNKDGKLGLNEIATLFLETQNKMTSLPATAQVASQQGHYIAKKLNKLARLRDKGQNINPHDAEDVYDIDDAETKPFKYRNLGSLAYLSNSAAFDIPLPGPLKPLGQWAGGLVGMYMWRSVYLAEACSNRMRLNLALDWCKRGLVGRDLSRL